MCEQAGLTRSLRESTCALGAREQSFCADRWTDSWTGGETNKQIVGQAHIQPLDRQAVGLCVKCFSLSCLILKCILLLS